MKCKVALSSDGQTQNFSCVGELITDKNRFKLSYIFNGENCTLSYDGKVLQHKKEGEIPVGLAFDLTENTVCTIGEGEFLGEIPITTKTLSVRIGERGIAVAVAYSLGGENKSMKITADLEEK